VSVNQRVFCSNICPNIKFLWNEINETTFETPTFEMCIGSESIRPKVTFSFPFTEIQLAELVKCIK